MTKRIEIRKILENGPETWREYARVEYSASQVCDMAKQDGLLLSEHEMSLYYRFDELDGELFAFGAYENKIPAGGGGKLIGFVRGTFIKKENTVSVLNLYVVQEYQNKKELRLGTKLLKAAEKFAKMQKAKKIRLVSTEYAYKFYIRKGYTDMGYMMKSL